MLCHQQIIRNHAVISPVVLIVVAAFMAFHYRCAIAAVVVATALPFAAATMCRCINCSPHCGMPHRFAVQSRKGNCFRIATAEFLSVCIKFISIDLFLFLLIFFFVSFFLFPVFCFVLLC